MKRMGSVSGPLFKPYTYILLLKKIASTYIFLHVVGHVGQVSLALSQWLLHVHHDPACLRVVLQDDGQNVVSQLWSIFVTLL